MKRPLALFAALLVGQAAFAQYDPPTDLSDPTQTSYVITGLPVGATCYWAMSAYNVAQIESQLTNEVSKAISADATATLSWTTPTQNTDGSPLTDLTGYKVYQRCDAIIVPLPPGNLTVDPSSLTAYGLSQSRDLLVLLEVGTVALGTVCDPLQSANSANRVPWSSVQFLPGTSAPVVFAYCQG